MAVVFACGNRASATDPVVRFEAFDAKVIAFEYALPALFDASDDAVETAFEYAVDALLEASADAVETALAYAVAAFDEASTAESDTAFAYAIAARAAASVVVDVPLMMTVFATVRVLVVLFHVKPADPANVLLSLN